MNALKRTITGALSIVIAAALASACGGDAKKPDDTKKTAEAKKPEKKAPEPEKDDSVPVDPKVTQAVAVAKEIGENPDDADAILEKHGLDREKIGALMQEIAKDPEMANAYESLLVEDS